MRWRGLLYLLRISPAKSEPWPPRQRSNCILKLWFVPKKWLINLTFTISFSRQVCILPTAIFTQKEETSSASFPSKRRHCEQHSAVTWGKTGCGSRCRNTTGSMLVGEDEIVTEIHEWSPPRTPHSSLFWKYNVWDPQTPNHLFLQSCGFHTG